MPSRLPSCAELIPAGEVHQPMRSAEPQTEKRKAIVVPIHSYVGANPFRSQRGGG